MGILLELKYLFLYFLSIELLSNNQNGSPGFGDGRLAEQV